MRTILGGAMACLLLAGLTFPAEAQRSVDVVLRQVAHSHVQGHAHLSASGRGTRVGLDVRGLRTGAVAYAYLRAGRCSDLAHLSASTAFLARLKGTGRRIRASTMLTYHGDSVALSVLTDGEHVIVLTIGSRLAACGTVPHRARG